MIRAIALMLSILVVMTGCAAGKGAGMDAAGFTEEEALGLSFDEQYRLLGERYEHMHELLADAQRQVSEDEWTWHDIGLIQAGTHAPQTLPGSTSDNSYYLSTTRSITRESAAGDVQDLDPVIDYFTDLGWECDTRSNEDGSRHTAIAVSDDGWTVRYDVQRNGQYNMSVASGAFWGEHYELSRTWVDAIDDFGPDASEPGTFVPFPY